MYFFIGLKYDATKNFPKKKDLVVGSNHCIAKVFYFGKYRKTEFYFYFMSQ